MSFFVAQIQTFPRIYYFNQPDLGFFLFDVGSDIFNGITFIDDGNPIWGAIILGVTLIPMAVVYFGTAIRECVKEDSPKSKKPLILLFAPILAVPAIPIMTAGYIVYVARVFVRKFVQPGYNDDDDGESVSYAGKLKLIEAVTEANLQAVLC